MRSYFLCGLLSFCTVLSLYAQCPTHIRPGVHVVQPNETLYRIALKYNISLGQLAHLNNITLDAVLPICTELKVSNTVSTPTEFSSAVVSEKSAEAKLPAESKQAGNKHIVQRGETFAGIADLYGYTEKRFREINPIPIGEEVTPGSILLSTDCICERVSYDVGTVKENTVSITPATTTTSSTTTRPAVTNSTIGNTTSTTPATTTTTAAPTASTTSTAYMKPEELAMLREINLVRSNPQAYVQHIQQYVADQRANDGFPISDQAVNGLISDLQALGPLSRISPTECIYTAAKNHGLDLKNKGQTDHQGSDGSWPWDRVTRACPQMTDGNENLVGGPADVREAVIILLIDDGIENRGHRKTLLNPSWKYGACYSIGQVGFMPNCWVQKFGY